MYRQLVTINPRCPAASSPVELHKLVMSGFRHVLSGGHPDARAQLGILFKPNRPAPKSVHGKPDRAAPATSVLIQSDCIADWTTSEFAADTAVGLQPNDAFELSTDTQPGDHIMLRGEYNPITSGPAPQGGRGKRRLITRAPEVGTWFTRQWATRGLDVHLEDMQISRPAWAKGKGHNIAGIQVTAHATVTDPAAFTLGIRGGLGRELAFGYGLTLHKLIQSIPPLTHPPLSTSHVPA